MSEGTLFLILSAGILLGYALVRCVLARKYMDRSVARILRDEPIFFNNTTEDCYVDFTNSTAHLAELEQDLRDKTAAAFAASMHGGDRA